jgi:hypothetical protein
MTTMEERYPGDGTTHLVCDKCGCCITCGDCICQPDKIPDDIPDIPNRPFPYDPDDEPDEDKVR